MRNVALPYLLPCKKTLFEEFNFFKWKSYFNDPLCFLYSAI